MGADNQEEAAAVLGMHCFNEALQCYLVCTCKLRSPFFAYDTVPMNNSKGAAFYASGYTASEVLRHYCPDLWTEAYAVQAVRDDEQRV